MKELVSRALDLAAMLGATYTDARIVHQESESITVKNGKVEAVSIGESLGFGVRVLVKGAWGFASSSEPEPTEVERVTALAVQIAHASSTVKGSDVPLSTAQAATDRYATPIVTDPFAVSLDAKIALLLKANEEMRRVKGIVVAESGYQAVRERKTFASSEGSYIEQEMVRIGGGIEATAADGDEVQRRSYPNSAGGQFANAGYELIEKMDLPGKGQRVAEEAVQLLSAKQCPSAVTTIILDSSQLALQVHESIGHPIELDRVFGTEAGYAGTSFLTADKLGRFLYGSDLVNVTADATVAGGLGTFGYDDEGTPAQRTPIIRNGIFVGFLTSRETASLLGQRSNGAMRADGWNRIPLIRMTNINLEPGQWAFEDLVADTDEGIYFETNKSWSIDDKRLNFQFGTEIAWEIARGKRGRMLKNATYTGITPQFWASCDAICNADHWQLWGTPNCGKGQPSQTAAVGHGTAPARFRNVRVGLMKG